jgi:flagellar hook protein FlgE
MGLSPSLYIGATGIMTHQTGLDVVSHNLANMNTTGFKASTAHFATLMSETISTGTSAFHQVGQGASVSSILRDMDVGPLETTSIGTDVAIGGEYGWFVLTDAAGTIRYSRAGNFRFDHEGYLRNPAGLMVHGVPAGSTQAGTGEPIRLTLSPDPQDPTASVAASPGQATSSITFVANLNAASLDTAPSSTAPFTALFDAWDASSNMLPSGAYLSSLTVYDAAGTAHPISLIFDPAKDAQPLQNGQRIMEFLVTTDPALDGSAGKTTKKGILGAGTLTFSPEGNLLSMSLFSGTSDDPAAWTPVPLDQEGYPLLPVTFSGAEPQNIRLDMGLRDTQAQPGWINPNATLASLGSDAANLPALGSPSKKALAMTNYMGPSATITQSQDGFGVGYLQDVFVRADGTLVGKYTNGQDLDLYRLVLADFTNPQGLRSEGGNLFSAAPEAGSIRYGFAGTGRLGQVRGSTLEQANVDLATEFVHMIIYQKGIEANAKVITTADQVIQTAIQSKRV